MTIRPFHDVRRILVAVDLGPAATPALDYAADMARCCDARLVVVHATGFSGSPLDLDATEPDPQLQANAARATFDAWAAGRPEDTAEMVTVHERAADGILEVASRRDVDLIVVAPVVRPGLEAAAHHSVTASLLRGSPCPVLAIPVHAD